MNHDQPSFRDRPLNINEKGSSRVLAKQPRGRWYTARTLFSWFFLLFLLIAPFIKIDGTPFMLLDVANRTFFIFGAVFKAQDTFILAMMSLSFLLLLVLITVVYGRLFCGWLCPQTIFLEMVYRRIEYLFEGNKRLKQNEQPPLIARLAKHIVFILVSVIFTNMIFMWFTGPEYLWQVIHQPIAQNWPLFLFMVLISAAYYIIYAFVRELVCTTFCPYGRLQGVLTDSKSIMVSYDYKRGEPRGARQNGDCIDCKQCIAVCPTGTDIRNGSQLECVQCTACIDECNAVMRKINKPTGLIRYDSDEGIKAGERKIWNPRSIAYLSVLGLVFVFFIYVFSARTPVELSVFRVRGTASQQLPGDTLMNLFQLKVVNKTNQNKNLTVALIDQKGSAKVAGDSIALKALESYESILFLKVNQHDLKGRKTKMKIGVYENQELLDQYKISFLGKRAFVESKEK